MIGKLTIAVLPCKGALAPKCYSFVDPPRARTAITLRPNRRSPILVMLRGWPPFVNAAYCRSLFAPRPAQKRCEPVALPLGGWDAHRALAHNAQWHARQERMKIAG